MSNVQNMNYGLFIIMIIGFILVFKFSNQKEKNKTLIIASYFLLFFPMILMTLITTIEIVLSEQFLNLLEHYNI